MERTEESGAIPAELIQALEKRLEKIVREEWQAGGGKPEGDTAPAPTGNASNGGDW